MDTKEAERILQKIVSAIEAAHASDVKDSDDASTRDLDAFDAIVDILKKEDLL